jgi:hypothetical protein
MCCGGLKRTREGVANMRECEKMLRGCERVPSRREGLDAARGCGRAVIS